MKNLFKIGLILFVGGAVVAGFLGKKLSDQDITKVQDYLTQKSSDSIKAVSDYSFDEKFMFHGVNELEIDSNFGDIKIEQSPNDDLHVVVKSKIDKSKIPGDKSKIVTSVSNKTFIKLADIFNESSSSSNWIRFNKNTVVISNTLEVLIQIPSHYKKMRINTVSADYHINNLNMDQLSINNVSGDIFLDQVKVKTAKVDTISGDFEFKDFKFTDVNLDTISGDLRFKFNKPSDLTVKLTAVSGSLEGDEYFKPYISDNTLKLGDPKRTITVDSVSGDLEFSKE